MNTGGTSFSWYASGGTMAAMAALWIAVAIGAAVLATTPVPHWPTLVILLTAPAIVLVAATTECVVTRNDSVRSIAAVVVVGAMLAYSAAGTGVFLVTLLTSVGA